MEERAKDAIRPPLKKIRHHVMSMTYAPKIEAVKSGECCQTIRKGRRFAVGDEILIHGWSGRPYRSKWSWRKRVVVKMAEIITVSVDGVRFASPIVYKWSNWRIDVTAALDYIDPPTGEALRDVLFGLNGAPDKPQEYQIIRWKVL